MFKKNTFLICVKILNESRVFYLFLFYGEARTLLGLHVNWTYCVYNVQEKYPFHLFLIVLWFHSIAIQKIFY